MVRTTSFPARQLVGLVVGMMMLAACAPAAPATKPAEPARPAEHAKPAEAARPAAAQPTTTSAARSAVEPRSW